MANERRHHHAAREEAEIGREEKDEGVGETDCAREPSLDDD